MGIKKILYKKQLEYSQKQKTEITINIKKRKNIHIKKNVYIYMSQKKLISNL